MTPERWQFLMDEHTASVREFCARAERVGDARWLVPRAEGKWTPAQETRHLILAYEAFLRDAAGKGRMQLRGNKVLRKLWRWVGLTSILWRKKIPVAARAPRESRPEWETAAPAELLPVFQARTAEFVATITRLQKHEPRRTFTHPYFDQMTIEQTFTMLTVHNRHHAAFLP
jgi:hypothetical protein